MIFFSQNFLKKIIFSLFSISILLYLSFQITRLVSDPELVVSEPARDMVVSLATQAVSGKTDPYAYLTINGKEVYPDEKGEFSESVKLKKGLNIIEIKAISRFKKESKVIRKIQY